MPSRLSDQIGRAVAWATGLALVGAFGGIALWLAIHGIRAIDLSFLTDHPSFGTNGQLVGGILDPLAGTLLITVLGTLLALPIGVATAIFLTEYRRPEPLARAAELAVEMIFGVPSVVIAVFGVAIFTRGWSVPLSSAVGHDGRAFGKSFLVCAVLMALLAVPPIVRSTQEALAQIPVSLREASYALGKTPGTTIRRVLLPAARPGIATGTILGMGRIAGDTAIVYLLLGGTATFGSGRHWWEPSHWLDTLRGTGATLTTHVYAASPVGEGNNDTIAYASAFVLLCVILALNGLVIGFSRRFAWKRES